MAVKVRFSRIAALLLTLLLPLAAACEKANPLSEREEQGSPERTLAELAHALRENKLDDALTYVDEQSKDRYTDFFTSVGPQGMTDYGTMLLGLTPTLKTDTHAEFTGIWTFENQSVPAKAKLRKDRFGSWKFLILE